MDTVADGRVGPVKHALVGLVQRLVLLVVIFNTFRYRHVARAFCVLPHDAIRAYLVHVGHEPERVHEVLVLLVYAKGHVHSGVAQLDAMQEYEAVEGTDSESDPRRDVDRLHFLQHAEDVDHLAVALASTPQHRLVYQRVRLREKIDLALDLHRVLVFVVALFFEEDVVGVGVSDASAYEYVMQRLERGVKIFLSEWHGFYQ